MLSHYKKNAHRNYNYYKSERNRRKMGSTTIERVKYIEMNRRSRSSVLSSQSVASSELTANVRVVCIFWIEIRSNLQCTSCGSQSLRAFFLSFASLRHACEIDRQQSLFHKLLFQVIEFSIEPKNKNREKHFSNDRKKLHRNGWSFDYFMHVQKKRFIFLLFQPL